MRPADLGPELSTHRTDPHKFGRAALVSLPIGAVMTVLGILLSVFEAGPTGADGDPQEFPTSLIGLGGGVLIVGLWLGWQYLRRTDELFTLHENGLVHTCGGLTRTITWDDVAKVKVRFKLGMLARKAGVDVQCRIKVATGRSVLLTGATDDAWRLAQVVKQAVDQRKKA